MRKCVNVVMCNSSYSSLRVGIYEPIRGLVTTPGEVPSYFQKVLAGGSSGAIGIMLANPTELIKVRMQADKTGTRYSGTFQALSNIIKTEGVL
jgi:solute carrier family 25 uncoupling protein 8/9